MNNIKAIRESVGVTQESLAIACGVSKGAISNYENSYRQPRVRTLTKMMNFFKSKGVDCDVFDIYPPEEYKKAS